MGEVVTDFLTNHFNEIVNLGFTAKIERNFDRIARGEEGWIDMMEGFYRPFHERIKEKETISRDEAVKPRVLGSDPDTGKPVSVSIGRYGPMIQIGTREDVEKPRFASLPIGSSLTEITLEEALECFKLPRTLGENEEGEEIEANIGRFGPYVRIGKEFFSLPKDLGPMDVELDQALEIIREGREAKAKKTLHQFGEIQVLNGRYGPYIKKGKDRFNIPKNIDIHQLTEKECILYIEKNNPPIIKKNENVIGIDDYGYCFIEMIGFYCNYIKYSGQIYPIPGTTYRSRFSERNFTHLTLEEAIEIVSDHETDQNI